VKFNPRIVGFAESGSRVVPKLLRSGKRAIDDDDEDDASGNGDDDDQDDDDDQIYIHDTS